MERSRRTARRLLCWVLVGLVGVGTLPACSLVAVLSVTAETRLGRWWGFLAMLGLVAAGVAVGGLLGRASTRVVATSLAAIATAAVMLAVSWPRPFTLPSDEEAYPLAAGFVDSPRWVHVGPFGRVPEVDWIAAGSRSLGRLGFWMSVEQRRTLREVPLRMAREAEAASPGVPPATGFAVAELLWQPFDFGHFYDYRPETEPGERLGLLVFLHGNGGNFKVLPWAFRELAQSERLVVLCPTYGFGWWDEGGVEAIDRAVEHLLSGESIDTSRIWLGGISDGGKGVIRAARASPRRYRGLVCISPTMIETELADPVFTESWRGRPIFVAHGGRDVNVSPRSVQVGVDRLRASAIRVEFAVYPDEDHGLFFARRRDLTTRLRLWMSSN